MEAIHLLGEYHSFSFAKKLRGACCIYRKRENTHKVLTQVNGFEQAKLSLFTCCSIFTCSSTRAPTNLTPATRRIFLSGYLKNSLFRQCTRMFSAEVRIKRHLVFGDFWGTFRRVVEAVMSFEVGNISQCSVNGGTVKFSMTAIKSQYLQKVSDFFLRLFYEDAIKRLILDRNSEGAGVLQTN